MKIQPHSSARAHSRMISIESNHSSRSPRSSMSCTQATAMERVMNPVQSSFGRSSRGGSGLMNISTPARAMSATGMRMKKTQLQEYSSLT